MESLPFHLLEEILFKLDLKSLAMMQCADKTIKSHISDDPYFKSEYLSRVGSDMLHISTFGSNLLFCHPSGDSRSTRDNYKEPLEIVSQILGSCSGLLLLFVDGLCVANPLTKRFRFLDHSESKLLPAIVRGHSPTISKLNWDKTNHIGFTVDRITQRFKIVCLIETIMASNPYETMYRFEINTGDSCWRLSKTTITCRSSNLKMGMKPVYVNGSLHWLRHDGSIVAFNPKTERARLIPIKFPQEGPSLKTLFAAGDNKLTLIWPRKEVIYVYALENILTDPKWILVRRIGNVVVNEKGLIYWDVVAYDGNCLMLREIKKDCLVHRYDLRANKWGVMGSFPRSCDSARHFYQFKPSFSSAMELVDDVMTMDHDDDRRMSSLTTIMGLIYEISPYALLNKKETRLGKRLMIEEETKIVKTLDKRRRVM